METKNHIKKSKKLFDPIRLSILLIIFLGLSTTTVVLSLDLNGKDSNGLEDSNDIFFDPNDPFDDDLFDGLENNPDGHRIHAGDTMPVVSPPDNSNNHEICMFSNESTTTDYFIPTRYTHEWSAVKSAASGSHDYLVLECCGDNCYCELPWGGYIFHGESVTAWLRDSTCTVTGCVSTNRNCNHGNLSGSTSYTYENCSYAACGPTQNYGNCSTGGSTDFVCAECDSNRCEYNRYESCTNHECVVSRQITQCCEGESSGCLTCNDLDELAAVNNGLNCGLGLDNNCGGTIDCTTNCSAGQVCATCPPGVDDITCHFSTPEGANIRGTCSNDTGCNAVVDVQGVSNRGRSFCVQSHEGQTCPIQSQTAQSPKQVRHINNNCEIYTHTWHDCSATHLEGTPPNPLYVSFDGDFYEQLIYAAHDGNYDINLIQCTADPINGNGNGNGNGPTQPGQM